MWYAIVIVAVTAYLLGSLNGAVIASHLFAKEDVRQKGSGNAGLTNFVRNYHSRGVVLVILIDAGKAVAACLLGGFLLKPYGFWLEGATLGGTCLMIGHDFPVFLRFKGGKGIFSGLFIALTIDWRIAVLILAVFVLAYFTTKYVSLGSVLASLAFAAGFVIFHYDNLSVAIGGVIMGLLAVFMHRGNIARLIKGQERKTDFFAKKKK